MILTAGLVSAQEAVTVSGTVTDATTGEPIEGALVQLNGSDPVLSANTDATGGYTIAGVLPGDQSVTASADGYASESVGALVSETVGATANFTLQPLEDGPEFDEQEDDAVAGKAAGTLKGFVGTYTTGTVTGGATLGAFIVTIKTSDVEIQVPDVGLEIITKRPGRPAGLPEDGDRFAVLAEFVDQGDVELAKVARQVIVQPIPKAPIVGAVVSIRDGENGSRILNIMRPDGTSKEIQLGSSGRSPEVGDLVTAFQGRDRSGSGSGGDQDDSDDDDDEEEDEDNSGSGSGSGGNSGSGS